MKKMKLDLDTLAVESYATQAAETATGTVAAHSDPILTIALTISITVATATITETLAAY
ncbi:MAG TPA: hypothetical protein VFJ16_22475 [Longimicrobium sp.]|nr:hypothetical protein [Longimicrobium sp.]